MSKFIVSARKYRPNRFEDVVGQEHVSLTLKNALQNDHLAHAFLFCGPRGVGKTTCARILAKVLNCQNPTADFEPCNECSSCASFSQNASFNITELDAASNNSVEHIRALIEQVRFQPQQGKYKIFIIDEVHMLSQQAFNAFLKTLEEPPPYAIFILATTEKHKIIPTILSRCQIFDFRRIQIPAMVAHLQNICKEESIEADPDALNIIGQKADGALRDALSIFDRIVAFSGKKITYEDVITNLNVLDYDYYFRVVDAFLVADISKVLLIFDDILRKGFDPDIFINGLAEHLRNLLVCKDPQTIGLLEISEGLGERYQKQAAISPASFLLTAINLANDCDIEFKMARNKRLHVEIALMKMSYVQQMVHQHQQPITQGDLAEKKTAELTESNATPAIPPVSAPETTPEPETVSPPESETAKSDANKPAITPANGTAKPAKKHKMSKVSLSNLLAEVKATDTDLISEDELNLDRIKEVWAQYIDHIDKEGVKSILRLAELDLEEQNLVVTIGSALAENTIRDERELMDFMREKLKASNLTMTINRDESKRQDPPPKPKKNLTAKEKFLLMREDNPNVHELMTRFQLRPDEH
ncbi:MAG: DNA polymerase III subunit gamma/tau [Saprospiraceae bacterium]|nr:MAG: DNA polymerase III subunit gamma/tau [Saprospiraceae bacterium]